MNTDAKYLQFKSISHYALERRISSYYSYNSNIIIPISCTLCSYAKPPYSYHTLTLSIPIHISDSHKYMQSHIHTHSYQRTLTHTLELILIVDLAENPIENRQKKRSLFVVGIQKSQWNNDKSKFISKILIWYAHSKPFMIDCERACPFYPPWKCIRLDNEKKPFQSRNFRRLFQL